MNKYIDGEKFKARVDKLQAEARTPLERNSYDLISMMLEDTMEDTPAADVKEVIRGKWNEVVFPTTLDPCSYEYRCSNCNALSDDRYDKFCPDCGADMKGVE